METFCRMMAYGGDDVMFLGIRNSFAGISQNPFQDSIRLSTQSVVS